MVWGWGVLQRPPSPPHQASAAPPSASSSAWGGNHTGHTFGRSPEPTVCCSSSQLVSAGFWPSSPCHRPTQSSFISDGTFKWMAVPCCLGQCLEGVWQDRSRNDGICRPCRKLSQAFRASTRASDRVQGGGPCGKQEGGPVLSGSSSFLTAHPRKD